MTEQADTSKTTAEALAGLKLLNIETSAVDGEFEFKIEITEEFEKWFKDAQGLKKWSEKRFNAWFKGLINQGLPEVHKEMLKNRTVDLS